ncbi:MAG: hypothetical protein CM15mP102_04010 [Flavobacteriales bacterium]|nr:MAG: hypothetical protein CM15mP102_04010 [Flavobacteriales bacterium]
MFELLELYEDESSSDFEQALNIRKSKKKAKVIVGQVFLRNFLLSIKITANLILYLALEHYFIFLIFF